MKDVPEPSDLFKAMEAVAREELGSTTHPYARDVVKEALTRHIERSVYVRAGSPLTPLFRVLLDHGVIATDKPPCRLAKEGHYPLLGEIAKLVREKMLYVCDGPGAFIATHFLNVDGKPIGIKNATQAVGQSLGTRKYPETQRDAHNLFLKAYPHLATTGQ